MARPLKQGILGASKIILSKDIDKYAFICGFEFFMNQTLFYLIPKTEIISKNEKFGQTQMEN